MTRTLTLAAARRIALAAQGFLDPAPPGGVVTTRYLQRVLDRVGVVQVDSVNVLTRSHYLPFFSRLGPYEQSRLDRMRDVGPRRLVEYWAHEASYLAPSTWPLLSFRMRRAEADSWGGMQRVAREHPELVEAVLEEVTRRGPMTSRQVEAALEQDLPRTSTDWGWNWSLTKNALEHLFWAGRLSTAGRTRSFERRYAALARVVPASPEPVRTRWLDPASRLEDEDAFVELVRISARALGVATARDLADYFRLKGAQALPAIQRLVALGELEPVTVAGWGRPAYLWVGERPARIPRSAHVEALLSPFDSLVWFRERTEALFGMRYRLEIYTPAAQRVHGYYVLPFLFGDRLGARVDLKADREAGVLWAQQVTWEPGGDDPAAVAALGRQLESMAGWLGLRDIALAR